MVTQITQMKLDNPVECSRCSKPHYYRNTKLCFDCMAIEKGIDAMALRSMEGTILFLEKKISDLKRDLAVIQGTNGNEAGML